MKLAGASGYGERDYPKTLTGEHVLQTLRKGSLGVKYFIAFFACGLIASIINIFTWTLTGNRANLFIGVFLLILATVLLLERAPYLPKRVLALLVGMLLYSAVATALIWLVAYFLFELSSAPVELALAMTVLAIILFTVIGYKGYTRAKQLEDFSE
ncbi:hypothetical protein Tagg_0262 [Thermosphaera aggregans DSM 11486]|uniref:Uncharacterized protein n=1 Tax=Thermosphaera aggregans (strain DSM 11486 / M11TL) TaxID=633148 RepID=D5U090_THEAM|nr:hypothetical protein Tagg_0262 [Thermosphaera aggregans DSM 11486]